MVKNSNWTHEETIIAFNAYCKIAFKESNKNHPLIIRYAEIIGRSPSALNMKIGNIGRWDPKLKNRGVTGLSHGSKIEGEVWEEFYANPEKFAYESECLIAKYAHTTVEDATDIDTSGLPEGKERVAMMRQRVNQSFFRNAVLSSYDSTCCISGVRIPQLVEACHISSWKDDVKNRTNPQNGLCLNPFFHRAYDGHLITVTPDYAIEVSEKLLEEIADETFRTYVQSINGQTIRLPEKFSPDRDLLQLHYEGFLKSL